MRSAPDRSPSPGFDEYQGERWTGRIAYVYPTLDTETRTVRVRVALANAGVRLKPGMYATLRITGASSATGAAVLTVPRGAVLSTGERTLVFVRRADGRLEPRSVQVGAASDDRIEILRGVALGDTVVASATFLVDAESNLGTALGGMGDMPGMEITVPPTSTPSRARRSGVTTRPASCEADAGHAHAGHLRHLRHLGHIGHIGHTGQDEPDPAGSVDRNARRERRDTRWPRRGDAMLETHHRVGRSATDSSCSC
ncbi:MAG: efflux RND transporter periplasmic adaptor subunit [Gemmatimonadetes bacterium]|nr:efflux RND transporter periplasmic adaptor subunit [Gemmatimonadota bacterium]